MLFSMRFQGHETVSIGNRVRVNDALINRVTQHDFVDTNVAQSCSKKEIWFMFNCQTKRTIVALFIYPKIPPCRVFFGGPVIEYLFVYTIAQSRTIAIFYRTICLPKPAQFSFFPAP